MVPPITMTGAAALHPDRGLLNPCHTCPEPIIDVPNASL